nr:hypothetical protein [Tanacetum cinerariifolium]
NSLISKTCAKDFVLQSSLPQLQLGIIYPNLIQLTITPDLEASRAHGFVHLLLELQSFAYGNPIS